MLVVIALVFSKADLNRRGQEVRAAARALAENRGWLADGYRLVERRGSSAVHGRLPISLVPAACAEMMLNAVLPGSVRETVNSEFDPRVCEGSSVY